MFGFLSSLQGQQDPSQMTEPAAAGTVEDSHTTEATSAAPSGAFSFWDIATVLSDTVKKSGADLASSVRDTDWRAELNAFRQGVAEESQQLKVSTAAAVEQLPVRATQAGTNLQQHLGGPEMQARLAKAGVNIEKFARKLVVSSSELVEDVKEAILAEMGPKASATGTKHSRSLLQPVIGDTEA